MADDHRFPREHGNQSSDRLFSRAKNLDAFGDMDGKHDCRIGSIRGRDLRWTCRDPIRFAPLLARRSDSMLRSFTRIARDYSWWVPCKYFAGPPRFDFF